MLLRRGRRPGRGSRRSPGGSRRWTRRSMPAASRSSRPRTGWCSTGSTRCCCWPSAWRSLVGVIGIVNTMLMAHGRAVRRVRRAAGQRLVAARRPGAGACRRHRPRPAGGHPGRRAGPRGRRRRQPVHRRGLHLTLGAPAHRRGARALAHHRRTRRRVSGLAGVPPGAHGRDPAGRPLRRLAAEVPDSQTKHRAPGA